MRVGWRHGCCHTFVTKTTVYLPTDLKRALQRTATASGRSEADLIREAIARLIDRTAPPAPKGALFASGDRSLAENVDAALAGFGER